MFKRGLCQEKYGFEVANEIEKQSDWREVSNDPLSKDDEGLKWTDRVRKKTHAKTWYIFEVL